MKAPPQTRAGLAGMPIFTRSFLLAMLALAIAQAIGLALMLTGAPLRNAPVPVANIALLLDPSRDPAAAIGGGAPLSRRKEIQVSDSDGPVRAPPPDLDAEAARRVLRALAAASGLAADTLTVHVRRGHVLGAPPGSAADAPMLGEGFYVAHRRPDGRLRVVESVLEGFPNAFHRQLLALLALGVALLLPLAWLFSVAMAQPMRRFAQAAHAVGVDAQAPPLPLDGPAEMRLAAASFNRMQERIQRLLEERTEMIAAIAHDLRTPLARLSFRLAELPEPAQRRAAADIDEMKTMIARTMDFCRARAASQLRDPLDFGLLVESVVDDYVDTGAAVSLAASEAVVVPGDALALRRAVGNLVDNALKYGQRARLSIRNLPSMVELVVDDDGPGIPPELLSHALRPFTRLENSRGRETGGIGLGLTVVRATVLDHGGELALETRPEGGLRASIRLPRRGSEEPAARR